MVDSSVREIRLDESGKVCGITLENGDEINADVVVSGIDPKSTFMCLVGPRHLEAGFIHKIQNIRMRGNASKVHLALSALPTFNGVDANDLGQRIVLSPTMHYLEQAFDFTKYQSCSDQLAMEIIIPSIHDASLAPDGHHVLSAIVNYTPYALKEGWDKAKPAVLENIVNTLNQYAPGIKEQILHAELLTPKDIAEDPHYQMRNVHIEWEDLNLGRKVKGNGITPKFSKTPGEVWRGSVPLGYDNHEIYTGLLGLNPEEMSSLQDKGVI